MLNPKPILGLSGGAKVASLSYADLLKDLGPKLEIPKFEGGESVLECAIAYIECGWWILPIRRGSKNPGSILGEGWPQKSSRDVGQARSWFSQDSNLGIALHTGKSCAFVLDVDDYAELKHELRKILKSSRAPFQSTRSNDPERGHYIFSVPFHKKYSNSPGDLGKKWGEIRTGNSVIVVYPSSHEKASVGGRYTWAVSGEVPLVPDEISEKLREKKSSELSFSAVQTLEAAELESFIQSLNGSLAIELLQIRADNANHNFASGSRHNALVQFLLGGFIEARAGLYAAADLLDVALNLFLRVKPRDEWTSSREFLDVARWAAAAARQEPEEHLNQVRETGLALLQPGVKAWLKAVSNV
jgi:Bifunctional DNA primase/polymerase, N-terminal